MQLCLRAHQCQETTDCLCYSLCSDMDAALLLGRLSSACTAQAVLPFALPQACSVQPFEPCPEQPFERKNICEYSKMTCKLV